MEIKNQALLTGAGFSCNVGGLSGRQFVLRLSNHHAIQENDRIARRLYAKGVDYESLYRTVIEDKGFDEDDRNAIIAAYNDVYHELDRSICLRFQDPRTLPLNLNSLTAFLNWFAGSSRERGHIFTLNQDLFLERGYLDGANLGVPGINNWRIRNWVPLVEWERLGHGQLPIRVIPDATGVQKFRENDELGREVPQALQYIKLHGSMNWIAEESSPVMVIAGRKLEQIRSVPLLDWYLEKFQQALAAPNMHLCVIGYSFGDLHINEELAQAISNDTLERISVVHPRWGRSDLETQIHDRHVEVGGDSQTAALIINATRKGQLFDFDLREACSSTGQIWDTDAGRRLGETFGPR